MATSAFVSVEPVLRFPIGVLAGAVATVAMNATMNRLPEGDMPPKVASGVLTDTAPEDSPDRLSEFVHYFAGVGTGVFYAYITLVFGTVLGEGTLSTMASAVFLYVGMVGFFVFVPLRVSDTKNRLGTTARDWSVCALVYVGVLVPAAESVSILAGRLL
jgi:hypothetical protein